MRSFSKWTQIGAADVGSTITISGEGRLGFFQSTQVGASNRAYVRRTIPAVPRSVVTVRVLARNISGDPRIIFDYPALGTSVRTVQIISRELIEYVVNWQVPASASTAAIVGIAVGVFSSQVGACEIYDAKIEVDGVDIDTVSDWVVESGSNANGTFERFGSGLLVCRKTISGMGPISEAWGGGFSSVRISMGNWATPFAEAPNVSVSSWSASGLSSWAYRQERSTPTWAAYVALARFTTSPATDYGVDAVGTGRWFV